MVNLRCIFPRNIKNCFDNQLNNKKGVFFPVVCSGLHWSVVTELVCAGLQRSILVLCESYNLLVSFLSTFARLSEPEKGGITAGKETEKKSWIPAVCFFSQNGLITPSTREFVSVYVCFTSWAGTRWPLALLGLFGCHDSLTLWHHHTQKHRQIATVTQTAQRAGFNTNSTSLPLHTDLNIY